MAVRLTPKPESRPGVQDVIAEFTAHAFDFAVREAVTAQTSDVRDLLLAKAFSESGVLEDILQGEFGDRIEEEKTDGLFKILSNA